MKSASEILGNPLDKKSTNMNNNTELSQEERMLDAVHEIMEAFQQECHETTKKVMNRSNKPITVQDTANVWFIRKLAEFELRLRALEQGQQRADGFLNMHTPIGGV